MPASRATRPSFTRWATRSCRSLIRPRASSCRASARAGVRSRSCADACRRCVASRPSRRATSAMFQSVRSSSVQQLQPALLGRARPARPAAAPRVPMPARLRRSRSRRSRPPAARGSRAAPGTARRPARPSRTAGKRAKPGSTTERPDDETVCVVGPAHRKLGGGRQVEAHAHPDFHLPLARAQDRPAAREVHLDEAREDPIGGAPRLVRHQQGDHRVQSVHGLDYIAEGLSAPRQLRCSQSADRRPWTLSKQILYTSRRLTNRKKEEARMRRFLERGAGWRAAARRGRHVPIAPRRERDGAGTPNGALVMEDGSPWPTPPPPPR